MKRMRNLTLSIGCFGLLLAATGCGRKPVVAQRPPDPTPVAQTAPAPTPTAAKPAAPKAAPQAPQSVAQAPRPTSLTPAERRTLNEALARLVDALFDYDKAAIRPDASTALRDDVGVIRDILANYPNQKLLVEGHADERGSEEYNLALGDRRAKAVQDFLTAMGVPSSQLTLISYGKERPVCTDQTEDCWQRNRRAHVTAAP